MVFITSYFSDEGFFGTGINVFDHYDIFSNIQHAEVIDLFNIKSLFFISNWPYNMIHILQLLL